MGEVLTQVWLKSIKKLEILDKTSECIKREDTIKKAQWLVLKIGGADFLHCLFTGFIVRMC